MLFYKVEGAPVNGGVEEASGRNAHRDNARKIALKSEAFNEKLCGQAFFFVSCIADTSMTIGVITEQRGKVDKTLQAYLKCIGYELTDVVKTEITFGSMLNLLSIANRMDYVTDDDEVLEQYGLDKVNGHRGRGIEYGENIIDDKSRSAVFADTEKYLMNKTFQPELERIYAGGGAAEPCGHPVHYLFQVDDRDTRRESYQTLLQALYANNRLSSRRYSFVDVKPGERFSMLSYDALYKMCSGGAVVVRYVANGVAEESGGDNSEEEVVKHLCAVAKRYRNQVLTVLCLPRECNRVKAQFYDHLGTMTFVEIQEDVVEGEQARAFLKMLAKEHHVRANKALFAHLEPGKGYLAPELHGMFDDWYNHKLKNTIYPQYKDLGISKQNSAKSAPKGSAYHDLQEMIGLTEAKAVIRKALNYYKMQKLYEDRGIKPDSPAMHMVFTGNPGTAKTTAARLFARIMKDNGLLSKGQLVEVGRGDLVGRYVGWTAQTVQAKFKEAQGGVLFIDEAYSLVDDRSGSYGDAAINTIVQEMENHREDVVVIFAGYPDEMDKFLRKNPGLRSRIAFHVPFADYTAEELCQIACAMGRRKGVCFEEAALTKLTAVFEEARKQSDFGNGRYVRNLLEQAKMNQASRLLECDFDTITMEEIKTIRAVDIVIPETKAEQKRTIGFVG